jgi:PKD repeat protein
MKSKPFALLLSGGLLALMLGLLPLASRADEPAAPLPLALVAGDPPDRVQPQSSTNWWATVQQDIHRSEYNITWQEPTDLADLPAAYQAPNRAQNLRLYVEPGGLRAMPRTDLEPAWVWGCRLEPLPQQNAAEPVVSANRVEYHYDEITLWFENGEGGVVQGLVVQQPPAGGQPLRLAQTWSGDLQATGTPERVDFFYDGVPVLRYGDLRVIDARGHVLTARLEVAGRELRIRADDGEAVYPLTVTVRITSLDGSAQTDEQVAGLPSAPDWLAEGDQEGAGFGYMVGTAGDVNGDGYDDLIVGAYAYDNGQTDEGRAFVYYGSSAGLGLNPAWTAEINQAGAYFGLAAGTAGDVNGDGYSDVIVGAPYYDNGQEDEGGVFVYYGSATGLSLTADWTAESDQAYSDFGLIAAATAGDVNGDGYDDIIVGADTYDHGQTDEGMAFVYFGSPAGLSSSPWWTAESNQAFSYLGISVNTAGDVNGDGYSDVIVGAHCYDHGQTDEGRAYVYHGSASGPSATANWTVESNQADAWLGAWVDTAGDVNGDGFADVVVGAPRYTNGQEEEGRAFVYHGSATGLNTSPAWMAEGDQEGAAFGSSVSTAGDINGDGYADVVVGAPPYTNGQLSVGRAYAYYGSALSLLSTPAWTAEGNQEFADFGWPVNAAGDVNGDGYADVAVGAERYSNGQAWEGGAFVYYGREDISGLVAANDSPTVLGHATTLTATVAAGSNVTYTWAFGDGGLGSGAVVSHTYPAVGIYTAVVTASNSVSALTATTSVTITDVPVAGLFVANDSPTTLGQATALTATVTAGTHVTYTWAYGDGLFGSGAIVSHTFPAVGAYTTMVTASNSVSSLTATTSVTITDVPIEGLTAINDSPTDLGAATVLTATVAAGSNVTYTWAFGDGERGGGAVVSYTYPVVGVYAAVVTASNSVSQLTATTSVTVTDVPIVGLTAINDSPTLLGSPTTLTATVTAGTHITYTWSFGDSLLGSGPVVTHTYPAVGVYAAVVTASNSVSQLTATMNVTVTQSSFHVYLPLVLKNP